MQWENLTATDFAAAARETGVCVLAMGVLEKHSEHLPLGTDFLTATASPAWPRSRSRPWCSRPSISARSTRRAVSPAR